LSSFNVCKLPFKMLQSALFATAALAAGALAQSPPSLPIDSQAGKLHLPVTCSIYYLFNQTFDTVLTATAPIYGGEGEEVYFNDVAVDITVPTNIVNLAPLLGASQAQVNVSLGVELSNASPSSITAFQGTLNNIPFSFGQESHIKIPVSGVLPPIGPITLGTAGTPVHITLAAVSVSIDLQDSTGASKFGPIPVYCGQQNIDYIIGTIQVNSTTGLAPLSPHVGSALSVPATPSNAESGAFRLPYDCVFGPLGTEHLDIILEGTVPLYLNPGEPFSLTNGKAFLTVPASVVRVAQIGWPKTTAFETTISNLQLNFKNANPSSFNAATTSIVSTTQIVSTTDDLVIAVPASGPLLTLGPVTAGADGSLASFQIGIANATTRLIDADGNTQYSLDVSCQVPFSLDLINIPITSQQPGNYSFL